MNELIRHLRWSLRKRLRQLRHAGTRVHPNPVFVLGNQKSGTTAIAAMISQMTGLEATLDLHWMHRPQQAVRWAEGSLQFDEIVRENRRGFANPIIKEPMLTFCFDEIVEMFPQSPIIFIVRDPRQNIRSILDRLGVAGDLESLPEARLDSIPSVWREVIENRRIGLAAQHYIQLLSERWNYCANECVRNEDRIIVSRYEDFCDAPEHEIARLASSVGLPLKQGARIVTSENYQPRGRNRGIAPEQFFGENLKYVEELCHDNMKQFGYQDAATTAVAPAHPI